LLFVPGRVCSGIWTVQELLLRHSTDSSRCATIACSPPDEPGIMDEALTHRWGCSASYALDL